MGLYKEIELPNGVVVRYHRVVQVAIITNEQNMIEVQSYTSKEKRDEEERATKAGEPVNVFSEAEFYTIPYDQTMTIIDAYNYLKTLPEFEGATDVLEDSE